MVGLLDTVKAAEAAVTSTYNQLFVLMSSQKEESTDNANLLNSNQLFNNAETHYLKQDANAWKEDIENVRAMEAVPDFIIGNYRSPDRTHWR